MDLTFAPKRDETGIYWPSLQNEHVGSPLEIIHATPGFWGLVDPCRCRLCGLDPHRPPPHRPPPCMVRGSPAATRLLFLVGKMSPNKEKFAEASNNESGGHQKRIKRRKCGIFLKVSGPTSMTTAHKTLKSGGKTEEMLIHFSFSNKAEPGVETHRWLPKTKGAAWAHGPIKTASLETTTCLLTAGVLQLHMETQRPVKCLNICMQAE